MSRHDDGSGRTTWDPAVDPVQPDASLGDLVGTLTHDLGDLVRKEIQLARMETSQEIERAKQAAIAGAAAAVAGLLALIMLSFALARLLDDWMDDALAWAIVGVLWLVVAGAGAMFAKKQIADKEHYSETTTTLKEDKQWISEQRS